jgi:hypothetical protein
MAGWEKLPEQTRWQVNAQVKSLGKSGLFSYSGKPAARDGQRAGTRRRTRSSGQAAKFRKDKHMCLPSRTWRAHLRDSASPYCRWQD